MKNIFKHCIVLFSLFGLLFLAGCPEHLNFDSSVSSGLRITISGDGVEGRTLFPSMPVFTKYVLEFSGPGSYDPIEVDIEERAVTIDNFPNGEWNITAIGFVTIAGEYKRAADGTTQVTVSGNSFSSINITISAKKTGEKGFFFYDVDFPGSIDSASLYIHDIGTSIWDSNPFNILTQGNRSGTIPLDPGFHMMTIVLKNNVITVAWVEVIHIYSNLTTKAERIFDEKYIKNIITIKGNANININGAPPAQAALEIFSDADYSTPFAYLDISNGVIAAYSMPAFETPTVFYCRLRAESNSGVFSRYLEPIVLYNSDHIFNINEVFMTIKISGNANITISGNAPGHAYIYIRQVSNNEVLSTMGAPVNLVNGYWELVLEPLEESVEVYFEVEAMDVNLGPTYKRRAEETINVFNSDVHINFTVDVSLLKVGGTISFIGSAGPPQWASVTMRCVKNDNWLGSSEVNLANSTWLIELELLESPANIYFVLECIDEDNMLLKKEVIHPVPLFNTNLLGIHFDFDIRKVVLSGNATVRVNGAAPQWAYATLYKTTGETLITFDLYLDEDGEGTWLCVLNPPFDVSTQVYFTVYGLDSEGESFQKSLDNFAVFNQNISNININVIIERTEITLSGTVNLTPQGFCPPDNDVSIYVLNQQDGIIGYTTINVTDTTWSVKIWSFEINTDVTFRIRWGSGGENYTINTGVNRTVRNTNITGIPLGTHNLYPSYMLWETDGWSINVNPSWLFNGVQVRQGEYYALHYSFRSSAYIPNLNAQIQDFTEGEELSDWRRVESNITAGSTYSGSIIFTIKRDASSTDSMANAVNFIVPVGNQTTLTFTELRIEKINSQSSRETWTVVTGQIFDIVGPGVTTVAQVIDFDGRNNVLHVRPGAGGYYHFIIAYDLSQYAGQTINISIQTNVRSSQNCTIAWQVNLGNNQYPNVIFQAVNANQWYDFDRNNNISIPLNGDDAGTILYLSAQQLGNAEAYFENFRMYITVNP